MPAASEGGGRLGGGRRGVFVIRVLRISLLPRCALDARGAFPGVELVGVAAVFVVQDGVEAGDNGLALVEQGVDGGGAFEAFVVVVVLRAVDGGQGGAVGADFLPTGPRT